ncbi:transposase family protein (plasmid) [Thermus oshimai JL-2]|uniref:Transposase family protein n=1 Tax=Thermus oshimai JL-2 TaxID=751945 RepID=K7RLI6_THEOS|nr:transposase [Thermus oshimai]AFV77247.1 transposase family protein [Thermus oshimai JL-2]
MKPAAQALLSRILALLPSPHLRDSLKALLLLLLQGHGKARPQHSKTKSPSALSRFLNRYPWPTRALIRLARKEAEKALDRARRRRRPKPRLLVVLDLVTLEKRGRFPHLPLSFFHGKWGLHLVVLYLVYGELRLPWAYRLWRGKGEKSLSLLALRLLSTLPPWMPRAFRIRVVADAAFGTARFLSGVKRMGLEAVVGVRRDRKGWEERVHLWGLPFPVWAFRYRYPLPGGGWEWRYGVATFPATSRTMLVWGRRRFSIEHFFRAMKSEFSLGQFGQRSAVGVHRFLVLSLLAYLLACWVRVEGEEGLTWRGAGVLAVRVLLPDLVVRVVLQELHALGLWPPGGGGNGVGLCRVCGRCKF